MHIFYTPEISTTCRLPEEESKHCVRVLRCKVGDEICLTDGQGGFYHARITNSDPNKCEFEILKKITEDCSFNYFINIAIAPTKNIDKVEWLVEKLTEIGVSELNFLRCRFSERKEIKNSRLQKILISAMKQSGRATLPVLNEMVDFKKFVAQTFNGQKFIAHCYSGEKPLLNNVYHQNKNVLILIGPEGDFSKEEIEWAEKNGFLSISLGKSRLRTETAAWAACHTIHVLNNG